MTAMPFTLTVDANRSIATVELVRPEIGNRLTADEVAELGRAIKAAGARRDVKIVVVRAKGEAFCLGRSPGTGPAPKTAHAIRSEVAEPILSLYADVRACEVPVLSVVQGPALGFGTAFVGVCDLGIATEAARFAFTEMDHNLPPTLAMSAVIDKIPAKRLMHMVVTRELIGPDEALSLGLISQVTTAAKVESALATTVGCLVDRDRSAVCAVKEYLLTGQKLDTAASARLAANTIAVILASQSH